MSEAVLLVVQVSGFVACLVCLCAIRKAEAAIADCSSRALEAQKQAKLCVELVTSMVDPNARIRAVEETARSLRRDR